MRKQLGVGLSAVVSGKRYWRTREMNRAFFKHRISVFLCSDAGEVLGVVAVDVRLEEVGKSP